MHSCALPSSPRFKFQVGMGRGPGKKIRVEHFQTQVASVFHLRALNLLLRPPFQILFLVDGRDGQQAATRRSHVIFRDKGSPRRIAPLIVLVLGDAPFKQLVPFPRINQREESRVQSSIPLYFPPRLRL
jgi:hypothetical protein